MSKTEKLTWKTLVDVMGLPAPTTKPSEDFPHVSQQGFFVRVGKKTRGTEGKDGKIRRSYVARVDVLQPDGTFRNSKVTLGLVEDYGTGDPVLKLSDALEAADKAIKDSKRQKKGGSVRYTVGAAYEKLKASLDSPTSTDSPDYRTKMMGVYDRFLTHLSKHYLDTLKEGFWIDYLAQLREGKLQVGTEKDAGKDVPILRKAGSVSYSLGVLNTVSRLYKVAHEYRGIEGEDKDWDPTRAAAKKMEAPNERETFLKFEDLRNAWAATDQLMAPWWRDMWRVYLLTGLRDKLVMNMRWEQIDFERGLYLIEPLAPGAKRRRKKLSQEERKKPIEMPLSSYVLNILRKRLQFAPKGTAGGWVWYSTETVRRKPTDLPRLTDPRASWQRITPVIGYWCYKHDLRRTFASVGATVDPSGVLALSLLMMHSSKTVSKALGVPQITVDYIKGQQRSMRALTEKISRAVLEIVGDMPPTELTTGIHDYEDLPQTIGQMLALEEKAPTRGEDFEEEAVGA